MKYRLEYSSKEDNPSVYIVCTVREPGKAYPVRRIIRKYGKKRTLLQKDPEALDKIRKLVEEMNQQQEQKGVSVMQQDFESLAQKQREVLAGQALSSGVPFDCRGAGLLILKRFYDELKLNYKFDYLSKQSPIKYDLAGIVKDLVLMRILKPGSKRRTSDKAAKDYLGFTSTNVEHMYKALDVLSEHKEDIVGYLNKQLKKQIKERDTTVCLYDITTYAFESTHADSLRDFGYSKDKKFNEVQVVMALATDHHGLPLDYGLYKGDQAEVSTLIPFISELQKKFGVGKFVVVADRALNCKSNIDALVKLGHDYVISFKVRAASEDIQTQVFDPSGRIAFRKVGEEGEVVDYGWYKEIVTEGPIQYDYPQYTYEQDHPTKLSELTKELNHQRTASGKVISHLKRRYIITWSASRADKDRKDRERLIKKAQWLISMPGQIRAGFKRGGRSFISIDVNEKSAKLDDQLIAKQEKFDGIHVVETSLSSPAQEVVKIYGGLWRIEDSFRHLKTQLRARPVFVRLPDHVRGHFLICYLALTILRYIEYKLDKAKKHMTTDQIIWVLNAAQIARFKPAADWELYGVKGFSEELQKILELAKLHCPNSYETADLLRRKLKLNCSLKSLFDFCTTAVSKN